MELSPTEESLLEAVVTNPTDETQRLIYADWLEEQGDERGEYLRLEYQLISGDGVANPETVVDRLAELRKTIDKAWLATVSRAAIESCTRMNGAWGDSPCPGQWRRMHQTSDPLIRICNECRRPVHYCCSVAEASALIQQHHVSASSHRVAIEPTVERKVDDLYERGGIVDENIRARLVRADQLNARESGFRGLLRKWRGGS